MYSVGMINDILETNYDIEENIGYWTYETYYENYTESEYDLSSQYKRENYVEVS